MSFLRRGLNNYQIPGITGAARTAARLVIRQIGPGARVIGLLGFPGHQAVFNVDLPTARTRAIHAMREPHDFVVLPARPVTVLSTAIFIGHHAVITGESVYFFLEKQQAIEEMAHFFIYLCFRVLFIYRSRALRLAPQERYRIHSHAERENDAIPNLPGYWRNVYIALPCCRFRPGR